MVSRLLKTLIFPFGIHYQAPADNIALAVCDGMTTQGVMRERMSHLCYLGESEDDPTGSMERAYLAMVEGDEIFKAITKAQKNGEIDRGMSLDKTVALAKEKDIITFEQADKLMAAEKLRLNAINVDSFTKDDFK
jgi:hypothetical protein